MSKSTQIGAFYGLIVLLGVFALISMRWLSYRTPHVEVSVRQYDVDKEDSLLMKYNITFNGDSLYYGIDSVITITKAASFPFLDKKVVTKTSRWASPVWSAN